MSTSTALVPFEQLNTMAAAFATSNMFGAKTKEQALSLLLLAQAEGVHPAIAMRDFDIIQGRPAKKAEAMHRSFLSAGGKIEWLQLSDTVAEATFSHPNGGSATIKWDMDRAKKAGLANKDMYGKYSRQMLRSRVVSEGCRTVYPAATSGLYVPEEVASFNPPPAGPKEKVMGAAQVVTDDEDITERMGQAAAAPAPSLPAQETSPPLPAAGSFISVDQVTLLRDRCAECDKKAEEAFLTIAKIESLEKLKVDDFDEALDWIERRKQRQAKK